MGTSTGGAEVEDKSGIVDDMKSIDFMISPTKNQKLFECCVIDLIFKMGKKKIDDKSVIL